MQIRKTAANLIEKKIIITTIILWIVVILLYLAYRYWGVSLVDKAYHEHSSSFLNHMIKGRNIHSINYYYEQTNRFVYEVLTFIFILSIAHPVYILLKRLVILIREKFDQDTESGQSFTVQSWFADPVLVPQAVMAFFLALLVSVLPLVFSQYPPLLDYPSHIARVYILHNWNELPILQEWYDIRSFLLPNVVMDLIVSLLAKLFTIDIAGRVFIALTLGITLSGCMFLHRCIFGYFTLWPLVSSLFLFNWILLFGFLNYLFGVGLLLWAVGAWISLSRSAPWFRILCGTLFSIALFFCHLATVGLYAIIVAGYEVQRSTGALGISKWKAVRDLLVGASIFVAPLLLFIASSTSGEASSVIDYVYPWGWTKLITIYRVLMSGNWLLDNLMVVVVAMFIVILICHGRLQVYKFMCLPLILLLITYLVMPETLLSGRYVDTRLPIAIIFVAIGCTQLKLRNKVWYRAVLSGLAVFLIFRSIVLSYNWYQYNQITQEFTTAFTRLPPNSTLFVASEGHYPDFYQGNRQLWQPPVWHLGSLATLQPSIIVPAIFAHPSQQPITVTERYAVLKAFQRDNPIKVQNSEELVTLIGRIQHLAADNDMQAKPLFLLVLDPKYPELSLPSNTTLIGSGTRFVLLNLSL
jgi:hypothetical protein